MSFSYLARREAQRQRVRLIYRRALRDTLNWAVHRHLFYEDADLLRKKFEVNKHVETASMLVFMLLCQILLNRTDDLDTIDRMVVEGEATYNKWRHPDPYIVPWAPGGSKFCRNPTPPAGIEIIYNYGQEEHLK